MKYARHVEIQYAAEEFALEFFGLRCPIENTKAGVLRADPVLVSLTGGESIVLSPQHVKRFAESLVRTIATYESKHGQIMDPAQSRILRPVAGSA